MWNSCELYLIAIYNPFRCSLYTLGSSMNWSVSLLTIVIRPPTRGRPYYLLSVRLSCKPCTNNVFRHRLSGKSQTRKRNRAECRAWGTAESAPLNSQYNAPRTIFYSCASFVLPVSSAISTEYYIAPDGYKRYFSPLLLCNTELWLNVLRKLLPSLYVTLLMYSWIL